MFCIVGRDGGYTIRNGDIVVVIPTVDASLVTPHSEAFQAVLAMIEGDRFGVRHVAGPEIASVYDFAVRLAPHFGVAATAVEPVSRTLFSAVEAQPRFQTLRSRDDVSGEGDRLTFDGMVDRLLHAYPPRVT